MKDELLNQIEASYQQATKGPWLVDARHREIIWSPSQIIARVRYSTDADLIAGSRMVVPMLVDEVRRLQGQLEWVTRQVDTLVERTRKGGQSRG